MKRLLALLMAMIALFTTTAFAEIDLTGMSFEELVALQNKINSAIWESDGWQSVTVPAGIYKIGEDIPAGKWVIRPIEGQTAMIKTGPKLYEDRSEVYYTWVEQITSPSDSYSEYNKVREVVVQLVGGYIEINSAPVIFEPYVGNSFLFK